MKREAPSGHLPFYDRVGLCRLQVAGDPKSKVPIVRRRIGRRSHQVLG
ncbi:uncharacterized protein METZ01_LOCUS207695, partial [marine metagenome]